MLITWLLSASLTPASAVAAKSSSCTSSLMADGKRHAECHAETNLDSANRALLQMTDCCQAPGQSPLGSSGTPWADCRLGSPQNSRRRRSPSGSTQAVLKRPMSPGDDWMDPVSHSRRSGTFSLGFAMASAGRCPILGKLRSTTKFS